MALKTVQGKEGEYFSLDIQSNEETIKNLTHLKKYDCVVYDRYHCIFAVNNLCTVC